MTCEEVDCVKTVLAKGLCSMHYQRERISRLGYCSVEGCPRPGYQKNLCGMHYSRLYRHGDAGPADRIVAPKSDGAPCTVADCLRPRDSQGLCAMHYQRLLRLGDPGEATPRRRPASRTKSNGYVYAYDDGGRLRLAHRIAMEQKLGRALTPSENVHHINGVKSDNRPENLELWVKAQPSGQRVEDLVEWIVAQYPALVEAALAGRPQLRLLG